MKLRKVISGGQTGVDRTGLECAKALGLETGGVVPRGWRTDEGPDPTLETFGCIQSYSETYPPRTEENVKRSDATVWFGNVNSPGGKATKNFCVKHNKPFVVNPTTARVRGIISAYETINIAGNRKRTNPEAMLLVVAAFEAIQAFQKEII